MDRIVNAPEDRLNRPRDVRPVDLAPPAKESARRSCVWRWQLERIPEAHIFQRGGQRSVRDIEIQIACQQRRHRPAVCGGIPDRFFELCDPKVLVSTAFQVEIVYGKRRARRLNFRYQRDSSAKAFLKQADRRQKPSGTPEIGLVAKADQPWIAQTPAGQGRLTVEGRRAAAALRQFLKFASEDVIHSE